MIFEKIKSAGLAHNSYFIGSGTEAAVIDPRRDCEVYLDYAEAHDLRITYIFETHRNEDYVIGSRELAHTTGAEIYHGHQMEFAYGNPVKEGDTFSVGTLTLEILETPGHTNESISIVVKDSTVSNGVLMVCTGDVLFAGDTGRVDFYGEKNTPKMAEKLYNGIVNKILPLGDDVVVCPAHGKGSVCGGNISDTEITTVGYERRTNSLLQMSKEEFIDYKVNEQHYTPPYFKRMEEYNKKGPPLLYTLPRPEPLTVDTIKEQMDAGAQVVDIRHPESYAGAHIPGSISLWHDGLPLFSGWVLNYDDPIILVDRSNYILEDAVRYLIRLGYDNIRGYLRGGFPTWYRNAEKIGRIEIWAVHELKNRLDDNIFILDVRDIHKWKNAHIPSAQHIYVGHIREKMNKVPKDRPVIIYCDSGFKTSIAASVLKKNGYDNVKNMLGGIMAWNNARYPLEKE